VKDWMAEENVLPFCSRLAFSATGVLELKNFSQFAVICAVAFEGAPVLWTAEGLPTGTDVEVPTGGEDDEPAGGVLLELLQAEAAAISARPSIGARITRRAGSWNRMTRPLNLGEWNGEGCHRLKVPLCLFRSLHRMVPDVLLRTHRCPT
jgi:hypothetical protein